MSHFLASGSVWHVRSGPLRHAFSYPMVYLWCDIDALDRGEACPPWVSSGRGGIFQLRREDHLLGTPGSWREGISAWTSRAGFPEAPRIRILTLPRVLGRTFNPVSFWIGSRDDGASLLWMVAEVNNTSGGRHLYAMEAPDGGSTELEWSVSKVFPVSPFHGVEGRYRFRVDLAPDRISFRVDLEDHGESPFRTGLELEPVVLSAGSVRKALLRMAASVVLTVPRILRQAARIHFGAKAGLAATVDRLDPWTIHQGRAVLLQRIFASPVLARIWVGMGRKTSIGNTRTTGT